MAQQVRVLIAKYNDFSDLCATSRSTKQPTTSKKKILLLITFVIVLMIHLIRNLRVERCILSWRTCW